MSVDNKSFNWDAIPVTTVSSADAAAGAQTTAITVPAGQRYQVISCGQTIVCSAAAANRIANLYISMDGTNLEYSGPNLLTVTASQTKWVSQMAMSLITTASTQNGMHMPLIEIPAGGTIRFYWTALDAADNLGVFRIMVKVAPA